MTVIHKPDTRLRPVAIRFVLAASLMAVMGLCHLAPSPAPAPTTSTAGIALTRSASEPGAAPSGHRAAPTADGQRPMAPTPNTRKAGGGGGRGLALPGVLRGR